MTEKETDLLRQALESDRPKESVNEQCRQILCERLQWDDQPDRELSYLLQNIVKSLYFPLSYKLVSEDDTMHRPTSKDKRWLLAAIILVGVIANLSDSMVMRILGLLVALVGGYALGAKILRPMPASPARTRLIIETTADMLAEQIDSVYATLTAFYRYHQLDNRHIQLMRWLQDYYAECSSVKDKERLARLLGSYGYEFVEFSHESINYFDVFESKVEAPTTTVPAIINKYKVCVCKGSAVMPMN